jgi:hypothetical protein
MVEAGESEYSVVLKTRKLLTFRDAKNAEHGKIAPPKLERIWNTGFQISCQFCEVFLKRRKISSPVNRFEPMNSPYGTPGHFTGKCGRSSAEVTRPALLPFSIASPRLPASRTGNC